MDTVMVVLRAGLAAVLLRTGIGMLRALAGSRRALEAFGVRRRLMVFLAPSLPMVDPVVGAPLLIHPAARWGAIAATALMIVFTGAIVRALAEENPPQC